MGLGFEGCDLACRRRSRSVFSSEIRSAEMFNANNKRMSTNMMSVNGYPAPKYVILMLVLFSRPPAAAAKYVSRPPRFLSPAPYSLSESSLRSLARCHPRVFPPVPPDPVEDIGPAVPNILRHSMRVLRGISKPALSTSSLSSSIPSFRRRCRWSSELRQSLSFAAPSSDSVSESGVVC